MSSDRFAPSAFPADNPLMPRLYQAAIGPLNTAYYQSLFERFDALGKPLPSWNWAAGCCTLGWMALRRLWLPAAVYAALVLAVALLWWALGLHTLLPRPAAGALALFLVLLAVVVPGLGGNALYHRSVRERTMQALTESTTLAQAMTQLQATAPTPARLQWAASGQALALLLAAGLAWGANHLPAPGAANAASVTPSRTAGTPGARPAHTQEDTARALAALSPAKTEAPAVVPPEATPAIATESTAAPEPAPAAAPSPAPVAAAVGAAAAAPAPPPAPAAQPLAVPAKPAPAEKSDKAGKPEKTSKPSPSDKAEKSDKADKTRKAEAADKADKARKTEAAAKAAKIAKGEPAKSASAKLLLSGKYYLNSGIYAQPDNARRVASRLRNEGLPVFTQTLESRKGEVTRVRVGPFDSRSQADAAAHKAQALRLEAQVFRHAGE